MVNPQIQGKRYPRTRPYIVGLEKLREFSAATFGNTADGFVVPPTFPIAIQEHSLSLVIADPEAGLDFLVWFMASSGLSMSGSLCQVMS